MGMLKTLDRKAEEKRPLASEREGVRKAVGAGNGDAKYEPTSYGLKEARELAAGEYRFPDRGTFKMEKALSRDEIRPVLTAGWLIKHDGKPVLCTCDSYGLAWVELAGQPTFDDPVSLSADTIKAIQKERKFKLLDGGEVEVAQGDGIFTFPKCPIDGRPPEFAQLWPIEAEGGADTDAEGAIGVNVRLLYDVAQAIGINVGGGGRNGHAGEGMRLTFHLNPDGTANGLRPMVLRPLHEQGQECKGLVMPIRLNV
jgi:hypothetical protein